MFMIDVHFKCPFVDATLVAVDVRFVITMVACLGRRRDHLVDGRKVTLPTDGMALASQSVKDVLPVLVTHDFVAA